MLGPKRSGSAQPPTLSAPPLVACGTNAIMAPFMSAKLSKPARGDREAVDVPAVAMVLETSSRSASRAIMARANR